MLTHPDSGSLCGIIVFFLRKSSVGAGGAGEVRECTATLFLLLYFIFSLLSRPRAGLAFSEYFLYHCRFLFLWRVRRLMSRMKGKKTHTHTHTVSLIPPWEDQREWHRMTRMTRPDCAVMCNLINTHTHTQHVVRSFLPNDVFLPCDHGLDF